MSVAARLLFFGLSGLFCVLTGRGGGGGMRNEGVV